LVVAPPVALKLQDAALIFPAAAAKAVDVAVTANAAAKGSVTVEIPAGWQVEPKSRDFDLSQEGQQVSLSFKITPPAKDSRGALRLIANTGSQAVSSGMQVIAYSHIPPQTVFPPATAVLVRADIQTSAKNIGYIMGAGDEIPRALSQAGWTVTLLDPNVIARGDLARYDAIVAGVCAYNVRADLRANHSRLLDYVKAGGTYVVQYNGIGGSPCSTRPEDLQRIGPYPLKIGTARVTVEQAPVTFPNPQHPVLQTPNKITAKDFEGWVQERGIYFASEWDPHYQPLFESHDPEDKPQSGGALYTKYGKGAYIFTGYAFFRELPAGVPGAYRIFANMLSAGKAGTTATAAATVPAVAKPATPVTAPAKK
jgi:hypothetical protein